MGWGFGDLLDNGVDLLGGAVDLGEDLVDLGEDVIEGIDELLEEAADLLDEAIENIDDLVGRAIDEMGDALEAGWEEAGDLVEQVGDVIETAWQTTSSAVETAWEELDKLVMAIAEAAEDLVIDAWDGLESAAESAWDALVDGAEAAWDAAETAAIGVADWAVFEYELALDVMDATLEWLGDLGEDFFDAIVKLGACLAGQVVYRLAKAGNVVANFYKPIHWLPSSSFAKDVGHLYTGTLFSDVFYVDDASLTGNWFEKGAPVDGMTFSGVTIAGFAVTHMIYLAKPWNELVSKDRELMAHELVHVQQMRKFKNHTGFACAYGMGYADAGFDYALNPLEAEAFNFVVANGAAIR